MGSSATGTPRHSSREGGVACGGSPRRPSRLGPGGDTTAPHSPPRLAAGNGGADGGATTLGAAWGGGGTRAETPTQSHVIGCAVAGDDDDGVSSRGSPSRASLTPELAECIRSAFLASFCAAMPRLGLGTASATAAAGRAGTGNTGTALHADADADAGSSSCGSPPEGDMLSGTGTTTTTLQSCLATPASHRPAMGASPSRSWRHQRQPGSGSSGCCSTGDDGWGPESPVAVADARATAARHRSGLEEPAAHPATKSMIPARARGSGTLAGGHIW